MFASVDNLRAALVSISGLVVEYIVAIDVTRVRFPADAFPVCNFNVHVMPHYAARKLWNMPRSSARHSRVVQRHLTTAVRDKSHHLGEEEDMIAFQYFV